jgi:outer membrane protein assembly factor BamD (BamD/ComL family)
MKRAALVTAVCLAAAGCGGGGNSSDQAKPDPRAVRYAKAEKAFHEGAFDTALAEFRSLGDYRDAAKRFERVQQVAGQRQLTKARRKLEHGHTRAAVALAQTASGRYGNHSAEALALLEDAEHAQSFYHHCQQDRIKHGKTTRGCSVLARKFAQKLVRENG